MFTYCTFSLLFVLWCRKVKKATPVLATLLSMPINKQIKPKKYEKSN